MFLKYFLVLTALLFVSASGAVLAESFDNGLVKSGSEAGYDDANLTETSFPTMIGKIVRIGIIFLGVFFFLLMVYAGFKWMLSRGNSQEVETAKKTMQNALLGLIVILLAYAITAFAMNLFSK